jgi:hypothetical protein
MTTPDRGRPAGRKIFRVWLAASALYVAVIGVISITPMRTAIEAARNAPPPAPVVQTTGPIHTPESPAMKAASVIGRQALLGLAPPLLLLWFGWDLWFAVSGFRQLRRDRRASPPDTRDR